MKQKNEVKVWTSVFWDTLYNSLYCFTVVKMTDRGDLQFYEFVEDNDYCNVYKPRSVGSANKKVRHQERSRLNIWAMAPIKSRRRVSSAEGGRIGWVMGRGVPSPAD